jgi:hypothetical protein
MLISKSTNILRPALIVPGVKSAISRPFLNYTIVIRTFYIKINPFLGENYVLASSKSYFRLSNF